MVIRVVCDSDLGDLTVGNIWSLLGHSLQLQSLLVLNCQIDGQ